MIDAKNLPGRILVDSNILISALGERRREPDTDICRDLVKAIVTSRKLLIAAPSVAELIRGQGGGGSDALARMRNVEVLAFDHDAARRLGRDFPAHVLQAVKNDICGPFQYIKYDALIVACAARHNADMIVTGETTGIRNLATRIGIPCARPVDFVESPAEGEEVRTEGRPQALATDTPNETTS